MGSRRNLKTQVVICAFFLAVGGISVSSGRTIYVPEEFNNIQAAIEDANDGALSDAEIRALHGDGPQR